MRDKCPLCGGVIENGALCPKCREKVLSRVNSHKSTKSSKFGAMRVSNGEESFDSRLEYRRWNELKLLEKGGVISQLERQVPFVLIEKSDYGQEIKYIADFVYQKDGKKVVEDTKSDATVTPVYKLKKRLMAEKYGIVIEEHYNKPKEPKKASKGKKKGRN